MHLLNVDKENYIGQADPFILKSQGRYYIYTTGHDGIYAYSSDSLFDGWKFEGMVLTDGVHDSWWAPSVIELDGKYYMYNSFEIEGYTPDKGGHKNIAAVHSAYRNRIHGAGMA